MMLNIVFILPNGQIYNENKIGPRIEPCGTPLFNLINAEHKLEDLSFKHLESTANIVMEARFCNMKGPKPDWDHLLEHSQLNMEQIVLKCPSRKYIFILI